MWSFVPNVISGWWQTKTNNHFYEHSLEEMLTFPEHGDPKFQSKIAELEEYRIFGIPPVTPVGTKEEYDDRVTKLCIFEKTLYQHLMQHYLSRRSPYRGLLMYHGLGVGKTCSSITIAEAMLTDHTVRDGPGIYVILPNALQKSYEEQVFNTLRLLDTEFIRNQCTGDTYRRMVFGSDPDLLKKKILAIVKSRYQMFTYDGFASEVEKWKKNGVYEKNITNKVFIVDEAHNLRIEETDKKVAQSLLEVAKNGVNNRIVLLSATPMYNEPDEIFWLLSILTTNDKRNDVLRRLPSLYNAKGEQSKTAFAQLKQLSSEYISYIKGTNPFTFATRLSPGKSHIPVLTTSERWEKSVPDDIIPTPLTPFQVDSIKSMSKSDAVLHQANNICFPTGASAKVGSKGFYSVFEREDDAEPIQVSYLQSRRNALFPTPEKLGVIAPKIQRICDFIKKAEGIVIVYSQFVWSGVLPLAVALEHMGFRRHGGRNILKNPDIIKPPVKYPGIPFPSYCILSGESAAMGNTKIEDILKVVNTRENKHGENIKVILMSPVAGEGLSLQNIREVHVLDPWYHLNRLDQVIGRAIRTCSHTMLPLEERNVTVFIHVAEGEESADMRTYQIAARKAKQMDEVEDVIRDASLDCSLLKNVNYFPKSLFGFDVTFRTSQGAVIPYQLGDDISQEPKCPYLDDISHKDSSSMRRTVYRQLLPTGLQRLRKFLQRWHDRHYFQRAELLQAIAMPEPVASSVLHQATQEGDFMKGFEFLVHKDGYVIRKMEKGRRPLSIQIIGEDKQLVDQETSDKVNIMAQQPINDPYVGKMLIYKALDSESWQAFAKAVLGFGGDIPDNIRSHVDILANEGAFVLRTEIPKHRTFKGSPFIGYVDIFNSSEFVAYMYDVDRNMFREATTTELSTIKEKRTLVTRPEQNEYVYAVMEPHKYVKKPNMPMVNELKIWMTGPTGGKRKGVVCDSLRKSETLRFLGDLGIDAVTHKDSTKEQVCFTLGIELQKHNRVYFLPNYKPKST
jgi:hypothetical protein